MDQQPRQKFQRSTKYQSSTKRLITSSQQSQSLLKKSVIYNAQSISKQTSPKKSQMSIDDAYHFVIRQREVYSNKQVVESFVNRIRRVVAKKQLKWFYRLRLFKLQKDKMLGTASFLTTIVRSIESRKTCSGFMRLKLNLEKFNTRKLAARQLSSLYKRKLKQNMLQSFNNLKSNKLHSKFKDLTQIQQKIQLSLTKDQLASKSLQSINQLLNPNKLLSPRSSQKQAQFQKFIQSIESNLTKQKDYQLGRINIQNLLKKFSKQEKFRERLKVYEVMMEVVTEMEKNAVVMRESNAVLYKVGSFLDVGNVAVSVTNGKQIRREVLTLRNKLQPNKRVQNSSMISKESGCSNNTIKRHQTSLLQNIQKVTQLVNVLFQQLSLKATQKSRLQLQHQQKLQFFSKQQTQLTKKLQSYHQNQTLIQSMINNLPNQPQSFIKQMQQVIKKLPKKKMLQYPYIVLNKINDYMQLQRRNMNEVNVALKSYAGLYTRKNLNEEAISQQKMRLNVKYEGNQVYNSIESVVGTIVVNAVDKQRQVNGVEIKRLKLENERLVRQIQLQRSKLMSLSQSSQHGSLNKQSLTPTNTIMTKSSTIQLSSTTQPNTKLQPIQQLLTLKTQNQQLTKTITQLQSKIIQLQSSIKIYQKTSIDNDLIKETLLGVVQKVEKEDGTWVKDVEVLKGGRNGKKYEMVVRVGEVIRGVIQRGRGELQQVERSNKVQLQGMLESARGVKEEQQRLKNSIGEANCINYNSNTPQINQQQNFSDSFQTLIYNSKYIKPQPHITQSNHFPQIPTTTTHQQNPSQPQTQSPLLLKGYSEQQLPQPQTSKQPQIQPNNELFNLLNRMSERVSWDVSFNPNEEDGRIRSRMTESLMLDNLLEDGSGEGLEGGDCGVGRGDRLGDNSNMARLSQLLLKQSQHQPQHQPPSYQLTTSIISSQQLHQLNSLITLALTNQLSLSQLAHHLPTLTNPNLTNILTLIQTYLNLNQKLSSLQQHHRQLQQFVIQRQKMIRNQRQVNEWIIWGNGEVEKFNGVVGQEVWQNRLNQMQQPAIGVVKMAQLLKKLSRYYVSIIAALKQQQLQQHHQRQLYNASSQQHQQLLFRISNITHTQQILTLQTQLQHQSTLILSLQQQLKQTHLNYQSQLQYYQRLQEQSYRSPQKSPLPTQRQIKTSRSTRSLKSVDSNTSSKSTKKMQQLKKDYRETLQQMSKQEKRLLEQMQRVNQEKDQLLEQVELLVNELKATRQKVIQLEGQLEERQQHQMSLKQRYEADFDMLRRDLQNVKLSVSEQVQTKSQQVEYFKQAYQILVTKYNSLITNQNNTITQITNNNSTSSNSKPTTQTPINPPAPSITQLSQQWGSLQYNNRIRQMIQNDVRREYNIRFLQMEQIVNGLTKEREFLLDVIKDKEQLQILLEEKGKECGQLKVKLEEKLINMRQLQYEKQQIQLQFKNVIKQIQTLNVKDRQMHEDNQQLIDEKGRLQQSLKALTLKLQHYQRQQQQKIQLHSKSYESEQHHKIKSINNNNQIINNTININIPNQMSANQSQQIRQVDENTYIVTRTVSGSNLLSNSMREITQVQQLRHRIQQLEQQRNQVIQSQVLKALKAQQQQFNHFYQQNVQKINQHYLNQVIPLKIKQTLNLNLNNSAEGHYTYTIQGSQSTIDHQPTNAKLPFSDPRQQQDYLQQKYQQWKLTYLPVILQLKRKQWIAQFQSTQLPKIIQLKYAQWQSVRLLAIMREEKNRWVLEQLWGELKGKVEGEGELKVKIKEYEQVVREYEVRIREMESSYSLRIKEMESNYELRVRQVERYWEGVMKSKQVQWLSNQQLVINNRIRQVQQYWQTIILPQRRTQYQSHHISLQQPNTTHLTTSTTYTPQQLTSIIQQQQSRLQLHYRTQLQTQLNLLKQQYQHNIIPQYYTQWRQQFQQQYNNSSRKLSSQQSLDIEQIIQQKYQQWKQTYLVQYLRVQREKWLREFREKEVEEIIKKKYEEWEGVRLLAIVKEERNRWIVDGIVKEKYQEWQWTILNNQRVKYQKLLQQQSVNNHKLLQQQSLKYQQLLQSKQQQLHNINQLLLTKQHLITQLNTQILSYSQQQQVIKLHSTQPTQHQHTILQLQTKLSQAEHHWQSLLTTQRQAFEKALTAERLGFQKTLEEALIVRTQQVEQYWQGVVLPRVKEEWEITYSARDIKVERDRSVEEEEQRIQREVSSRVSLLVEERVREEIAKVLQQHRQLWIQQYLQSQQFRQYISSQHLLTAQYQTKLTDLRHSLQTQLTLKYTTQLAHLNTILQAKDNHLQQLLRDIQTILKEKQQLQTSNHQLLEQLSHLQHQLTQQRNSYNIIKQQLQNSQSITNIKQLQSIQNIRHKQVVYQMQAKHTQQLNDIQLQYEEKLSQINLQKSLLSMQLKQLQLSYQKLQTTAKSTKQSISSNTSNIATLQANYQKQLLSLQSTIRTKQSQITFLKKSIDSSTYQNQQLNARAAQLSQKVVLLQQSIDELKGQVVKYQYEVKYWKEKELAYNKKLQAKQLQHTQVKSRLQLQKSSLQKKLRQSSTTSTAVSSLTIKLTQLQSQLSLKHSALKQLQNQTQKKRRQLQQQRQKSFSLLKQIELYKSTIKQHESIVQDLRLEIRKSCDEINRQKVVIDVFEGKEGQWNLKERALVEQVSRLEAKGRDRAELEQVIRENQRLRQQLYKTRQHITYLQTTHSKSITSLKQTIHTLTHRLHLSTLHNRSGDLTQLQILKRVNTQVSQLVTTNKQLQTRILILQNQKQLTAFGLTIERFFVAFQEQMDNLVNYLVGNNVWRGESLGAYGRFGNKAREALGHGYVEDYFRQWQGFMRKEIEGNLEIVNRNQVRSMNANTLRNGTQLNANDRQLLNTDEQLLEKYDAVLNDVKFTLIQYLKSGQEQYLHIMAKSLGVEECSKQLKAQLNVQDLSHGYVNQHQKTVIRQ